MTEATQACSPSRSAWDKDALWYYEATLKCGHKVVFGVVPLHVLEGLVPRRKDGSFGALRCPHGRRRVVMTKQRQPVGLGNVVTPAANTRLRHEIDCDLDESCTCSQPRRFAYADPPYPGQAKRHYGKNGDPFEGEIAEVDHAELIATLERDFPDGWALSTSVPALPYVLSLCPEAEPSKKRTWNGRAGVKLGTGVWVGAWYRTGYPFPPSRVMWSWEPVIFRTPHWRQRHRSDFVPDSMYATQPRGFLGNSITGQKPEVFCFWIFDLLGMTRADEFIDLFPGSGAVTAAWEKWRSQSTIFEEIGA